MERIRSGHKQFSSDRSVRSAAGRRIGMHGEEWHVVLKDVIPALSWLAASVGVWFAAAGRAEVEACGVGASPRQ
jgi:hypothetical protein